MGDNILMKKLTLSLVLLVSLSSANDLAWVNEQIDAIKPPRDGERNSNINKINSPFIFLEKNGYIVKIDDSSEVSDTNSSAKSNDSSIKPVFSDLSFRLSMIMNNSALINGKWYKVDDLVNKYKITKISKSAVTLKQNAITKVISTATKNDSLKFKR